MQTKTLSTADCVSRSASISADTRTRCCSNVVMVAGTGGGYYRTAAGRHACRLYRDDARRRIADGGRLLDATELEVERGARCVSHNFRFRWGGGCLLLSTRNVYARSD